MPHELAAHGMRLDEITDVQDRHFELSDEAKRKATASGITVAATNARTAANATARAKQAGPAPSDKEQKAALSKSRSKEIAAEVAARNQHLATVLKIPEVAKKTGPPERDEKAPADDDDFAILEQIAEEQSETQT